MYIIPQMISVKFYQGMLRSLLLSLESPPVHHSTAEELSIRAYKTIKNIKPQNKRQQKFT